MIPLKKRKPTKCGTKTCLVVLLTVLQLGMLPSLLFNNSLSLSSSTTVASPQQLPSHIEDIPANSDQPAGKAQTAGLEQRLDKFFSGRRELFFIESGAYDGIAHSNTLWLERQRNWTGLLVEGNPNMAKKVRSCGRSRSKLVDGCLSPSTQPQTVQFKLAGPVGGIVSEMDVKHQKRVSQEIAAKERWMDEQNVGDTVDVQCYPVNQLLSDLDRTLVDFWSLDTEGSEVSILKTVDFQKFLFGLVFIESNPYAPGHRRQVTEIMTSNGFVDKTDTMGGQQDTAWAHPDYCVKFGCGTVASPQELPSHIEDIPANSDQPAGKAQTAGLEQRLDKFFSGRRELFFIKSGAYDGIAHSNTLWLERERNWTGLLVEGNPNMAKKVRSCGRSRSKLVDGCLSPSTQPQTVQFKLAGPVGGIVSEMDVKHQKRVSQEIAAKERWMDEQNVGDTVDVQCYPVNQLLSDLDRTLVDFWSLDTEGSEVSILKTVDFQKFLFGLVFIESNPYAPGHRRQVTEIMTSNGFVDKTDTMGGQQDTAWAHPDYCVKFGCGV